MPLLAVSAIGADRPGIVAAVTGVLLEHGCNLEDTSMTILRGHFAMTLVVRGDADAAPLQAALRDVADPLGLAVIVRVITDEPSHAESAGSHVISVYGADHPGIVHRVSALLADHDVNITDLSTRLVGDPPGLYAMVLRVQVPAAGDAEELGRALTALAAELNIEATLRPADAEIL